MHEISRYRLCLRRRVTTGLLTFTTGLLIFAAGHSLADNHHTNGSLEDTLVQTLDDLSQQRIQPAFNRIEKLVAENPDFRLAQLIYADLLLAKAQPLTDFGAHPMAPKKQVQGLRDEARKRWAHFVASHDDSTLPASIIQLAPTTKHVLVIELDKSRLYVFANNNGIPKLIDDYYVTIGKKGVDKLRQGDKKTPIGVYAVTRFIPDKKLPDFYGSGAFPIDYPNKWDHRLGKTGYGIWLHGTPVDTYSRPPRASDGCVALSNDEFEQLMPFVSIQQTPVIITQNIDWIPLTEWQQRQASLTELVRNWQHDWQSLDTQAYLGHYSAEDFRYSGNKTFTQWSEHKQRVNANKQFIHVGLSALNIFAYPGEDGMIEISFKQRYRSNNYNNTSNKRQYWKKDGNGDWKIIYEGPA